ncbi:hypothetical protein G9A89_000238 [Geosiphon pyriformis]|nr:hypothetical protein G9A89_000238 [Geosiphon pyriformis]
MSTPQVVGQIGDQNTSSRYSIRVFGWSLGYGGGDVSFEYWIHTYPPPTPTYGSYPLPPPTTTTPTTPLLECILDPNGTQIHSKHWWCGCGTCPWYSYFEKMVTCGSDTWGYFYPLPCSELWVGQPTDPKSLEINLDKMDDPPMDTHGSQIQTIHFLKCGWKVLFGIPFLWVLGLGILTYPPLCGVKGLVIQPCLWELFWLDWVLNWEIQPCVGDVLVLRMGLGDPTVGVFVYGYTGLHTLLPDWLLICGWNGVGNKGNGRIWSLLGWDHWVQEQYRVMGVELTLDPGHCSLVIVGELDLGTGICVYFVVVWFAVGVVVVTCNHVRVLYPGPRAFYPLDLRGFGGRVNGRCVFYGFGVTMGRIGLYPLCPANGWVLGLSFRSSTDGCKWFCSGVTQDGYKGSHCLEMVVGVPWFGTPIHGTSGCEGCLVMVLDGYHYCVGHVLSMYSLGSHDPPPFQTHDPPPPFDPGSSPEPCPPHDLDWVVMGFLVLGVI